MNWGLGVDGEANLGFIMVKFNIGKYEELVLVYTSSEMEFVEFEEE